MVFVQPPELNNIPCVHVCPFRSHLSCQHKVFIITVLTSGRYCDINLAEVKTFELAESLKFNFFHFLARMCRGQRAPEIQANRGSWVGGREGENQQTLPTQAHILPWGEMVSRSAVTGWKYCNVRKLGSNQWIGIQDWKERLNLIYKVT